MSNVFPSGFPAVTSVGAWCLLLAHRCDGVAGECPCSCHTAPANLYPLARNIGARASRPDATE